MEQLSKQKNGLYSLSETSQYNSLKEAKLAIPKGIIYFGTTLPNYPPVKRFYSSGDFYKTGITTEEPDSGETV